MSTPLDRLTVLRHRRPLTRTLHALSRGAATIGFLGGSITAEYGTGINWPNPLANWLVETFPRVRFTLENAAIGATGSDSACVRAAREILARNCDLTFVEYAVNDNDDGPRRNHSREGLLRKLLAAGQDVVLVYTYRQDFYREMMEGKVPASIAEFEVLAEHYGISSAWMGLAALRDVCAGRMKWEDWLPDGLHPQIYGSTHYARTVISLLEIELSEGKRANAAAPPPPALPAPLFEKNWEHLHVLLWQEVRTTGPWALKRFYSPEHVDQALETHAPGAGLEFDFTGRGLVLIVQYGKRAAEFDYRIDGGEWISHQHPRHDWGGERTMVRATFLTEDLPHGPHRFEMRVTHGNRPDCTGTECRLAAIGVIA